MNYSFYPAVKQCVYEQDWCQIDQLFGAVSSSVPGSAEMEKLPMALRPLPEQAGAGFYYCVGQVSPLPEPAEPQSYTLRVSPKGIAIQAADLAGLRYGIDTLAQLLAQAAENRLRCLTIQDHPAVIRRGLMLDISRGKVYSREYLMGLVELLGRLRYNVFQLYVEHTFDFHKHPEISANSDPLTADDILAIQESCEVWGIDFQPNLQSLGHCARILTRPAYQHIAESDMFWSLSTTSAEALDLLDDMYGEYLPLFKSEWLNVGMDEPYDIGQGRSAASGQGNDELYFNFLLKVHALAARYGKKIMVFGDFLLNHPEMLARMPDDITFLDWCYDPKPRYGTPELFAKFQVPFWVCPGTGNWNTLFPRLDGAITNVTNLVGEGIADGAEGMLLTDWNDHGAYTQPGPGYFLYVFAAATAWAGVAPAAEAADTYADVALGQPGYATVVRKLAEIYQLPPIWSGNRSQCVMALFDEPILGNAVRGQLPPDGLKAYDRTLPEGVQTVYERHSQHPLRPVFSIPPDVCRRIAEVTASARGPVSRWQESKLKHQFTFILDAFELTISKLALSRSILERFDSGQIGIADLLAFEDALRLLIRRFVKLQLAYTENWLAVAKFSELNISLTYYAGVIARLDYLREWLSIQREQINCGKAVDIDFATYQSCGYTTLPTY
jgi:hypothetical protein